MLPLILSNINKKQNSQSVRRFLRSKSSIFTKRPIIYTYCIYIYIYIYIHIYILHILMNIKYTERWIGGQSNKMNSRKIDRYIDIQTDKQRNKLWKHI